MVDFYNDVEIFKDVVLQAIFNKKMISVIKETTGSNLGGFLYPSTEHTIDLLEFVYNDEEQLIRSIIESWASLIKIDEKDEFILTEISNQLEKLFYILMDEIEDYDDEEDYDDDEEEGLDVEIDDYERFQPNNDVKIKMGSEKPSFPRKILIQ